MGQIYSNGPVYLHQRCNKPLIIHLLESQVGLDQIVEDHSDDSFDIRVTVGASQDLRWWLVAKSSHLDILEPAYLQDVVIQSLEAGLKRQKVGSLTVIPTLSHD